MLTPIQAITSALLTALIVQLITLKYTENNNFSEINGEDKNIQTVDDSNSQFSEINSVVPSRSEEPEEVNKLLDAIFVSHGTEVNESDNIDEHEITQKVDNQQIQVVEEVKTPKNILFLNNDNFKALYSDDWLVLAHVPWYPYSAEYLNHFKEQYTSALSEANSTLNLAVLDCHTHPRLAALLNVRSYPSLNLVTTSGRLREWPFPINLLNQQSLRFLLNAEWRNLPVYQLLQRDNKENPNIYVNELQIKVFNILSSIIFKYEPLLSALIVNNRHAISIGLLCGFGLSYHLFRKQAITTQ